MVLLKVIEKCSASSSDHDVFYFPYFSHVIRYYQDSLGHPSSEILQKACLALPKCDVSRFSPQLKFDRNWIFSWEVLIPIFSDHNVGISGILSHICIVSCDAEHLYNQLQATDFKIK